MNLAIITHSSFLGRVVSSFHHSIGGDNQALTYTASLVLRFLLHNIMKANVPKIDIPATCV